ncbi:hypothetical protein TNCV_3489401 [Trichonephila clavipes]|nr:hypothetical protein TNCV_3489401 [Trichonephila clavipes]
MLAKAAVVTPPVRRGYARHNAACGTGTRLKRGRGAISAPSVIGAYTARLYAAAVREAAIIVVLQTVKCCSRSWHCLCYTCRAANKPTS